MRQRNLSAQLRNLSWDRPIGIPAVRARHETVEEWLTRNWSSVKYLAWRYGTGIKMEKEDLIQEAALAVVKAWGRYDPHRCDATALTYYGRCIQNHMAHIRRDQAAEMRSSTAEVSQGEEVRVMPETGGKRTSGAQTWRTRLGDLRDVGLYKGGVDTPETLAEVNDLKEKILAVIESKSTADQEIFWTIVEGGSQQELAKKMGLSQSAIWNRAYELRKDLREVVLKYKGGVK
jgi:RNA polymerase sigma factor (sigma-70 family)